MTHGKSRQIMINRSLLMFMAYFLRSYNEQ